jgi:hypothetical protein
MRRYIVFHGKRHPTDLGAADISAFLTDLAVARHVAASTQNQALSALLFLYREVLAKDVGVVEPVIRARVPVKVPVVLSVEGQGPKGSPCHVARDPAGSDARTPSGGEDPASG